VVLHYTVPFSQNWGGWTVSGTTDYTSTAGVPAITGQSAALALAGGPLSLASDPAATSLGLPLLTPALPAANAVPSTAAAPGVAMLWSANGLSGLAQGLHADAASGLVLDALSLALPLSDGAGHPSYTVTFPQVSVGPAPGYSLRSASATLPSGLPITLVNDEGWVVSNLQSASLLGSGWSLPTASRAAITSGRVLVSSDAAATQPTALVLDPGAYLEGSSIRRAPVQIPASGLFVTAGNLTVQVIHAVVKGDRLDIAQGYALIPGLSSPTALELDDLSLDTQGRWWAGPAYRSILTGTITTDSGTLSADPNAFVIQDGQLVLLLATLTRADGSALTVNNLPFDNAGMGSGTATVTGPFEGTYFGFPVHATGGKVVNAVRVFDTATIDLPAFGVSGLTISGLGVSLADDHLVLPGVASQNTGLQTGYGTQGIQAASLTLAPAGVTAVLTASLPQSWGSSPLPLGVRTLTSSGSVGADPGVAYPTVTYQGFVFQPVSVALRFAGLVFDKLALTGYDPVGVPGPEFAGLALKADGTIVVPGAAMAPVVARYAPWAFTFDALRLDSGGLDGEPLIDLPAALGGTSFRLGTTTLKSDGTFTNQPSTDGVQLEIFGWSCIAASLALEGPHFRLGGVTVLLPGLMQGQDIGVGSVVVDTTGALVSCDSTAQASFRGTNGFRVQATGVRFDPRGLVMGGKVFLPEVLGGSADIPDGQLFLEPDGAVIAGTETISVSFPFASWAVSSTRVTVDRSGMSFHGNSVNPLGLASINLPDITVYSTGELAVGGQSLASGTFQLPAGSTGMKVDYSGVRFDDTGVHLSATVTLPPSWGDASLDFDDVLITPDGHVSAASSLHNVVLNLDALGLVASFDVVRLSPEGLRLDGVGFQVQAGPLAGQSLTIDAALLDFSGNLDLYGFGFAPLDLYGYKVILGSLSVGTTGFGFTGGIRLAESLPIPELQGAYLALSKFRMGFDGQIQEFKVSLDQGLQFTLYDSWTLGIQGLTIDKNLLTVNQATLDLPASFNIGQLAVSGMTLDLQTGAITWGQIAVTGTQYQWNGLTFVLSKLTITPDRGLLFGGSVTVGAQASDGTPYPAILQNRTFLFNALQILPSGLPGTIDASANNLNGPLFDQNVLIQNGTVSFNNSGGNLIFGFSGAVQLGTGFMPGIAGLVLQIHDLRFNVADGTFAGLDVSIAAGLAPLSLPGGLQYQPSTLGFKKTSDRAFDVETSGNFLLGASFPGILRNRTIAVSTFVMKSDGTLQALAAQLDIPEDQLLINGLLLSNASIAVTKDPSSSQLKYSTTGSITMGPEFLDGLAGLSLTIKQLDWDGAGSLLALDVATSWTGVRTFFGGSTIQDGTVTLAGSSPQAWTVGMQGFFRLPSTGLPSGLAGLGLNIQTLKFKNDGSIEDVSISSDVLNLDLFGFAKLSGGHLGLSKYDTHALAIALTGNLLLPTSLPAGLAGKTVVLNDFSFTTGGKLLKLNGTLGLDQSIPLFAGINMVGATVGFSMDGVSLLGARIVLPPTMFEGLPDTVALQRVLIGWDGSLKDVAAGIGHAIVRLGGFTTDITNLIVSTSGVSIERAVLTLPPNLSSRQILVLNAGFDTSGRFTGTIGVDEINQDIAGFGLNLRIITFDVGSKILRIQTTTIHTPKIGSLNANIQLNAVTVSPSGVNLGGVGFDLPNYDYGGIGFRNVRVSFVVSGSSFEVSGSGQGQIPGLGVLDAQLAFTNISSVYPIGLRRAYFQYTFSAGVPLGATGLFLNQIRGGITYGPPSEMPGDLSPLFDALGPRLQLGVGMSAATGPNTLQMNANFWIDLKNASWAFDGQATVLSGLATGRLAAGYGNNILYGTFSFSLRFVNGQVQIWVFPYNGSTVVSGRGSLTFVLPRHSLLKWWYPTFYWAGADWHEDGFPGSDMPLGGVSAEFGQFYQGAGAKGWVSAFGVSMGAFVDGGGIHFNIGDYSLIKPAGY